MHDTKIGFRERRWDCNKESEVTDRKDALQKY